MPPFVVILGRIRPARPQRARCAGRNFAYQWAFVMAPQQIPNS
jgi:hypothetical protein